MAGTMLSLSRALPTDNVLKVNVHQAIWWASLTALSPIINNADGVVLEKKAPGRRGRFLFYKGPKTGLRFLIRILNKIKSFDPSSTLKYAYKRSYLEQNLGKKFSIKTRGKSYREIFREIGKKSNITIYTSPLLISNKEICQREIQGEKTLKEIVAFLNQALGSGIVHTEAHSIMLGIVEPGISWGGPWYKKIDVFIFPIGDLIREFSAKKLLNAIRKNVEPETWETPGIVLEYLPGREGLLIVATPKLIHKIEKYLSNMRQNLMRSYRDNE
jgi:hypothetical protein